MRGQIGGLAQAQRNAQDGISLVQTAEGALTEVHSMLQRVRDLKVQYAQRHAGSEDKDAIAAEVSQLGTEIGKIAADTTFNGTAAAQRLGHAELPGRRQRQRDDHREPRSTWPAAPAVSKVLHVARDAAYGSDRRSRVSDIDRRAIKDVSTARADFGAVQNRLEHRLNNLATYQENLTASESRIRDVDMAAEMTKFTKLNILQQAGTSMLAQANQAPAGRPLAAALSTSSLDAPRAVTQDRPSRGRIRSV